MPIDVIDNDQEEIFRKIKNLELPLGLAEILIEQHDQIKTLQTVINKNLEQQMELLQAIKLSQELHKRFGSQLQRLETDYGDRYKDYIRSEKKEQENEG